MKRMPRPMLFMIVLLGLLACATAGAQTSSPTPFASPLPSPAATSSPTPVPGSPPKIYLYHSS